MRYRKLISVTAGVLAALSMLGPFTACEKQEFPTHETGSAYSDKQNSTNAENSSKNENYQTKLTLDDINPVFTPYKENLKIDEESLRQIVRIALEDAQKFYVDMGAPNMTYDKNLNVVKGNDNFYTDWMNENFYMARAMSESSLRVDVVTDIKSNPAENDAHGIMQICPVGVKETLQQYYQDVFGVTIDLSKLEVIPSQKDLQEFYYSKEAQKNIVKAVYNNIYLSICFDIYNVKCLNPVAHQDYYEKFGGFSEDIRRLAAIGLYGTKREYVLNGLKNGTLKQDLLAIDDIKIYLDNLKSWESYYANQVKQAEAQPER